MPSNIPIPNPADAARQFINQKLGAGAKPTQQRMGQGLPTQFNQQPQVDTRGATTKVNLGESPAAQIGNKTKTIGDAGLSNALVTRNAIRAKKAARQPTPATGNRSYSSNTGGTNVGSLSGTRAGVINEASSYLGNRYVFAGNSHAGIDCSGLVQQVYRKFGIELPRLAAQQRDTMPGIRTSVNNLKAGDLVAWTDGSHVAIYAGDGYIIQAANPSQGVIKSKLTNQVGYTPNSVIGIAIRFPGE